MKLVFLWYIYVTLKLRENKFDIIVCSYVLNIILARREMTFPGV